MPTADLLTTRQVADQLGLTVRQVHTLIERGDLTPAHRLTPPTGGYLFKPADVARVEAERAAVQS